MDISSATDNILTLYRLLGSIGSIAQAIRTERPGPLDLENWKNCTSLHVEGKRFFGAWDISFKDDQNGWTPLVDSFIHVHSDTQQNPSLPTIQAEDTIRLSIEAHAATAVPVATSSFTGLSSQWREADSNLWHHITTYETSVPARIVRYVRVFEDESKRPQAHILCRTFVIRQDEQRFTSMPDFFSAAELAEEIRTLDTAYRSVRTRHSWKQVLLLQVHHACLRFFAKSLKDLAYLFRADGTTNIDPAWAELRLWNLRQLTKHSYELRHLREVSDELVSTIESLIDVVKASDVSQRKLSNFVAIEMELRGYCREVEKRLQKLSEDLEQDLKLLELSRNVNQTRGVQQLTLLATIFLPLSLASGVLSMQTRFKDLGSLLYDFFGVIVLLGAIVVTSFLIMIVTGVVKDQESRLLRFGFYRERVRGKLTLVFSLGLASYGSIIISSFLVGMFKDISIGARILGYGSAAIFGLLLIFILLVGGVILYPW
ncbi:hypothetical protein QQS21_007151 [Conoideocrella luteorostrata]|uniref:Mg2+ transporter protein n=1 Tax=Conoideocrella luteorostrata TaxID=1105319 RepID=A0AAJ0FZP6_9HYPO|nr:hypothetical protein QQS21_007151 [Conoideocrella luteorostrata]